MNTKERVNSFIENQVGSAGWEQKLLNLVRSIQDKAYETGYSHARSPESIAYLESFEAGYNEAKEELRAKFGIKKDMKYDVCYSDEVIVITPAKKSGSDIKSVPKRK